MTLSYTTMAAISESVSGLVCVLDTYIVAYHPWLLLRLTSFEHLHNIVSEQHG